MLDGTVVNHHADDLTGEGAVDLVRLDQVVDSDDLKGNKGKKRKTRVSA